MSEFKWRHFECEMNFAIKLHGAGCGICQCLLLREEIVGP